jgi:hypothetical protein
MLVSIVGSLIGFNFVSAIVSAIIGFYVLFQVKPLYGVHAQAQNGLVT